MYAGDTKLNSFVDQPDSNENRANRMVTDSGLSDAQC